MTLPEDPRQVAYAQQRADWQRDVWPALIQRIEDAIVRAAKEKAP